MGCGAKTAVGYGVFQMTSQRYSADVFDQLMILRRKRQGQPCYLSFDRNLEELRLATQKGVSAGEQLKNKDFTIDLFQGLNRLTEEATEEGSSRC